MKFRYISLLVLLCESANSFCFTKSHGIILKAKECVVNTFPVASSIFRNSGRTMKTRIELKAIDGKQSAISQGIILQGRREALMRVFTAASFFIGLPHTVLAQPKEEKFVGPGKDRNKIAVIIRLNNRS